MHKKMIVDWFKWSANLKKTIGAAYLLIAGSCLYFMAIINDLDLCRLLLCYYFGFFGLCVRAGLVYGFFIKNEKKVLKEGEVRKCISDYIFYGIAVFVTVSFIYLTSYKNFNEMSRGVFLFIAVGLFFPCGLVVVHVIENFLRKKQALYINLNQRRNFYEGNRK